MTLYHATITVSKGDLFGTIEHTAHHLTEQATEDAARADALGLVRCYGPRATLATLEIANAEVQRIYTSMKRKEPQP